jgi:polysaccharide export outer membrane protein
LQGSFSLELMPVPLWPAAAKKEEGVSMRHLGSKLVVIGVAALLVGSSVAQQTNAPASQSVPASNFTNTSSQTNTPVLQDRNQRYKIQNGDSLVLDFRFTPEYNATVAVQPDGYISLRGIGDLKAEGLTLPELNQQLETNYAKILHDPVITVTPQEFVHPSFTAGGQVGKPGKYDLHGDTTVVQAIAMAGGFTDDAKHSQVLLFRRVSNDTVSAKIINVKQMLNSRNLNEDVHLEPGDTLYVPKNFISKIQPYLPLNTFRASYILR